MNWFRKNFIFLSIAAIIILLVFIIGFALVQRLDVDNPLVDLAQSTPRVVFFLLSGLSILALIVGILVVSVIGIIHANEELNEKQNEISSIITNLSDSLIEHDEKQHIFLINPMAKRILGISRHQNLADPYNNLSRLFQLKYNKPDPNSPLLLDSPLNTARGIEIAEMKIEKPTARSLAIISIPFLISTPQGLEKRFIKIIRDITKEQLISELKSQFISIAAHQLRTPLSAIKWILAMFLKGDTGALDKLQADFIQKAYDANERMILLVSDLLDVSRIEEGRFGYSFQKADIKKYMHSLLNELQSTLLEKKLAMRVEGDADIPFLFIDPQKITMALSNILSNSINYTLPGGEIKVIFSQNEKIVTLDISDTGVGIPADQQKHIFTKFFRGKNIKNIQTEGSGLGLYIAKNIIEAHGGTIQLTSKEGEGTTVRIAIPKEPHVSEESLGQEKGISEFLKVL